MKAALPRLHLIRHGETEWSLSGRHTGTTDLPLTEHGAAIARGLKPYLAKTHFALVLTSPRLRARDTCMLAGLGERAQVSADLSEWDYGDYEGRTSGDIHKETPGWEIFRDGCPNGETPAQVAERADRLIAGLLALEGNIALFSHGHFGCVLAVRWIGLASGEGQHFALDPASVSVLGPKPGHPEVAVIASWNTMPLQAESETGAEGDHAGR